MSIRFDLNDWDNLLNSDCLEDIDYNKKFALFECTLLSSEGNKYMFSGWDFDNEPNYDELYKCARKDFFEYYEGSNDDLVYGSPEFNQDLMDDVINRIMNGYIIIDLEKLKEKMEEKEAVGPEL